MANMKYDQGWGKDEIENWKKIFIGSERSTQVPHVYWWPFRILSSEYQTWFFRFLSAPGALTLTWRKVFISFPSPMASDGWNLVILHQILPKISRGLCMKNLFPQREKNVFKTKWHYIARRMNCEERNGRVYPPSTPALFCGSFLCLIERCFDNRFSRMRGRKQFSRLADRFQIALFAVEIFHLDCYALKRRKENCTKPQGKSWWEDIKKTLDRQQRLRAKQGMQMARSVRR